MQDRERHYYEFGPFRLDPVKRRLLHNEEPLPLAPKAFDTLLALVQQSGKTIDKDDLMKRVWPDAVVEENNLNQNITALRKSLGDSRHESKYIATIPGFGYRFVAEVKLAPGDPPVASTAQKGDSPAIVESPVRVSNGSGEPVIASLKRHRKVAALVLALVMTGAAGMAILVYRQVGTERTGTAGNQIEVTPLTRTGTTGTAAISPDGRYIVYSAREAGRESLWLRQLSSSSAQQIGAPADVGYSGLMFSRD